MNDNINTDLQTRIFSQNNQHTFLVLFCSSEPVPTVRQYASPRTCSCSNTSTAIRTLAGAHSSFRPHGMTLRFLAVGHHLTTCSFLQNHVARSLPLDRALVPVTCSLDLDLDLLLL